MSETWTTLRVLDWTASRFARAEIESPRLEAQILLSHVLHCDRVALYTSFEKPLATDELASYRALIKRRLAGESVAYLIGKKEFWSREFAVDARVLVPRADTETLIAAVLERDKLAPAGAIVDIGTGSGAIAVTLACELPERDIIAVDVSTDALAVAAANAERHGAADRISFRQGSLLEPVAGESLAMIVANLPYVEAAEIDTLDPEVRAEPRLALDGGADGLDLIRRLVGSIDGAGAGVPVPGGLIALEHGHDQGRAVRDLLAAAGSWTGIETIQDLAGRDRVTLAFRA